MQVTSYYSGPTEQALLTLQVREAELRVAREELAFLRECGGVGGEDVKRLRRGLGLVEEEGDGAVVVKVEDDAIVKEEEVENGGNGTGDLVSLKSVIAPLVIEASVNQQCRRLRPVLERHGFMMFKRKKVVHVRRSDARRISVIVSMNLELDRQFHG
jgi:hypothetical protein